MRRRITRMLVGVAIVSATVVTGLALLGGPAGAQQAPAEDPSCTATYPPPAPHLEPDLRLSLADGLLRPGTSTGHVTLLGADPGAVYTGTLFSSPIDIPATAADSSGTLRFTNLVIPASFSVPGSHTLYVYRDGCLAGAYDPCISPTGQLLTTCPAGQRADKGGGSGLLPRTGMDRLIAMLKAAGVLLAGGTLLRYTRRRRVARLTRA